MRSNPITKLIGLLGFTLFVFTITMAVVDKNENLTVMSQEEQIIEALNGTLEVAEKIQIRKNHRLELDSKTEEIVVIKTTPKQDKKSTVLLYALL